MNEVFEKCLAVVLKNEGWWSNDPADSGGETIMGISRNNFPDWIGWKDVDVAKTNNNLDSLKTDQQFIDLVHAWYKTNFWDKVRGDDLVQIDINLAMEVFDTAVNMNWTVSGSFVQTALNVMNFNYRTKTEFYPDLVVDGRIGNDTIKALKALPLADIPVLIQIINGYQIVRYAEIAKVKPKNEKFIRGWIKKRTMEPFFE